MLTEVGTNQGGDSIHFLHQLGSSLRATGGLVSYYPVHAFMGSLPRVTSRNGILTFTITDLYLLDTQCHTCCMAQCNDLLRPMSIISAASMTAPAASIAVTTAAVTQTVVTTSATANSAVFKFGAGLQPYLGLRWGYQSVSRCWFMPVHFSACFVSFLFARLCMLCTCMHSLRCMCTLHIHTRFCMMLTM